MNNWILCHHHSDDKWFQVPDDWELLMNMMDLNSEINLRLLVLGESIASPTLIFVSVRLEIGRNVVPIESSYCWSDKFQKLQLIIPLSSENPWRFEMNKLFSNLFLKYIFSIWCIYWIATYFPKIFLALTIMINSICTLHLRRKVIVSN